MKEGELNTNLWFTDGAEQCLQGLGFLVQLWEEKQTEIRTKLIIFEKKYFRHVTTIDNTDLVSDYNFICFILWAL